MIDTIRFNIYLVNIVTSDNFGSHMSASAEDINRRPYHHGDLRNALIDAGVRLLAEEGVHALDLRKVARLAGVSHAAPYRHFQDKQALLLAIVEEGFRRLGLAVEQTLAANDTEPTTQLLAMGKAYVLFAIDQPAYFRLMFSGHSNTSTEPSEQENTAKTSFRVLMGIIQRGQEQGKFVGTDPELLAQTAWAMVHGIATLLVDDQLEIDSADREAVERMTQDALDLVCRGIEQRL